jgi:hypothetical protein
MVATTDRDPLLGPPSLKQGQDWPDVPVPKAKNLENGTKARLHLEGEPNHNPLAPALPVGLGRDATVSAALEKTGN